MKRIRGLSFIGWYLLSVLVIIIACIVLWSCGSYTQTEPYSVTTNIELPKGMKLVKPIWKGDKLWYLLEPMDSIYIPKNKVLQEKSPLGVLAEKIVFIESK